MYRDDQDGKMIYDVLDKDSKSAFKSNDYDEAREYLSKNFDKLREGEPSDEEDRQEKMKALQDIQMDKHTAKDPELQKELMKRKQELQKTEGNQFAQAVQKAKAAGMKAGDKFKVGDKEYTLKDAIEQAGLQLEDFYSEEEQAYDQQIDRIKNLASYTI